jgi:hypothetical protein
MKDELSLSETSVLTRITRRNILEDAILQASYTFVQFSSAICPSTVGALGCTVTPTEHHFVTFSCLTRLLLPCTSMELGIVGFVPEFRHITVGTAAAKRLDSQHKKRFSSPQRLDLWYSTCGARVPADTLKHLRAAVKTPDGLCTIEERMLFRCKCNL